MGLDLKIKHSILKDHEQIFRSCQVKFVHPSKNYASLTAIKFENYKALYIEIQKYCNQLFDQIWIKHFESKDIYSKYNKLLMLKYTDFNIETKLTSSFRQSCIKHIVGIFNSFIEGHNFALSKNDENLLIKKSAKPEIKEFEISFTWCDINTNRKICFIQINGCGEYGIKCKTDIHHPNSMVLRLPFKFSKYHRSKFKNWELCSPSLCKDGIRLNFVRLIPKRLDQKQNSKLKEFISGQVGCDQGINSVITLAYKDKNDIIHSFQSPSKDRQGWSLSKIIEKMKRCKKVLSNMQDIRN